MSPRGDQGGRTHCPPGGIKGGELRAVTHRRSNQATVNLFSLYQIGRIDRNVPRLIWGETVELDELEVQAPLRLIHLGQPSDQLLPFADHELAMLHMPPAEAELAYANLIIYAPSLMKSEEADIAFFTGGFAQNPQTRELAHQAWPAFSEGFLRLAREGRKIDARQYALLRLGAQLVDQERADLTRIRARWQAMRRERLRVHERNHERARPGGAPGPSSDHRADSTPQ